MATPFRGPSFTMASVLLQVTFKYRDRTVKIKVDREGGSNELARLKNLVSRWKAGVVIAPVVVPSGSDAGASSDGTGSGGASGGGGGGGGGSRRRDRGESRRRRGGDEGRMA